jgi:endonuclease YncB( thermonuclease family)
MGWKGYVRVSSVCWLASICALFCAFGARPAGAQSAPANACHFEAFGSGQVAGVIDGRSIRLADGREVRLAGIEVPPVPGPGETGPQAAAGLAAKAALEQILAGQTVEFRRQSSATDRYGRVIAHVIAQVQVAGGAIARPVALEMVSRGHARVAAQVGDAACAAELLSQERAARAAKLGLWADPYYVVMAAGKGSELLAERGHFTVVEGRVVSVRESGGTIYLNFGRRWSEALTVTILKRHERIFLGAGVWPKRLENRVVRVRGWIDERNGPRIEASRPEQIEIAELN